MGHHIVFGAPFIAAGCRLETPAATVFSDRDYGEDSSARILHGQRTAWPTVFGRAGEMIDLREIHGAETGAHDAVYVTDLDSGYARVTNPDLGLAAKLVWDASIFRWVVLWQEFGGVASGALAGTYGLGVEPWSSRNNLDESLQNRSTLELGGGRSMIAEIALTVEEL